MIDLHDIKLLMPSMYAMTNNSAFPSRAGEGGGRLLPHPARAFVWLCVCEYYRTLQHKMPLNSDRKHYGNQRQREYCSRHVIEYNPLPSVNTIENSHEYLLVNQDFIETNLSFV